MQINDIIAQLTVERLQANAQLAEAQERIKTLEAQLAAKDEEDTRKEEIL